MQDLFVGCRLEGWSALFFGDARDARLLTHPPAVPASRASMKKKDQMLHWLHMANILSKTNNKCSKIDRISSKNWENQFLEKIASGPVVDAIYSECGVRFNNTSKQNWPALVLIVQVLGPAL